MRWMGVLFASLAAMVVSLSAGRLAGRTAAVVAGLAFALSPKIITTAVEIRSYPLFLLTSSCAFYSLIRIVREPGTYSPRWAAWLAVSLLASMYTHFFGVVAALCLWTAALLAVGFQRGRLRPLVTGAVVTALLSVGLLPFVRSSVEMTDHTEPAAHWVQDLVRYPYRLFAHPALGSSGALSALACISFGILVLLALFPVRSSSGPVFALAVSLASGSVMVKSFRVLTPNYSLWMIPGLSILISLVGLSRWPAGPRVGRVAQGLLLGCLLNGVYILERHGSLYAHSPYARLSALMKEPENRKIIVIHDCSEFGISYFPLYFGFGGDLEQYARVSTEPWRLCRLIPGANLAETIRFGDLKPARLVMIRSEWISSTELGQELRGQRPPIPPGPLTQELLRSPEWRLVQSEQIVANSGAVVHIFEPR
jgi:hypothetical protein